MFKNKKVLIGITGSIAAYKIPELVRLFKKSGALVKVIQTKESLSFVSELTLSTLSKNPVLTYLKDNKEWNNHIELALWADVFIIAPATAKTISKMANGECDNLLLATYLSAKCPVFFAPAMDLDMFKHPSTSSNISKLQQYGNTLIPPGIGELASGLIGEGRMAEPSDIIKNVTKYLQKDLPLRGKKILITAGPTYEAIDPVRFISNRSSGKMGVAIAKEAAKKGALVDIILGPSSEKCSHPNIKVHNIETAKEMYSITNLLFPQSNISIFAAAVSDYTPIKKNKQKIKKDSKEILLKLTQNKDIIACMSKKKTKKQFIVGFALETENEIQNAKLKLKRKKLDMIIMNSINKKNSVFGSKKNKITIIEKNDNITHFKSKEKKEVAIDIIDKITSNL